MKKDDYWFISLIALLVIAVCTGWSIWAAMAVIANSVLILLQVACRVYEIVRKDKENG